MGFKSHGRGMSGNPASIRSAVVAVLGFCASQSPQAPEIFTHVRTVHALAIRVNCWPTLCYLCAKGVLLQKERVCGDAGC
jgi:hypothetical protein